MSDTDIIRFEVSDNIALVTLNRPPVNALDRAMRDRLIEIFDQISEREDIRVAVLTSSQRVFCATRPVQEGRIPRPQSCHA